MISTEDILIAARRIAGRVRRTPLLAIPAGTVPQPVNVELYLKLEFLQVTGSFKPRGAFNRVLSESGGPVRGLVTSSGGNHGIAVAYVGHELELPVVIPLPETVAQEKIAAMRALGATANIVGPTFLVSNAEAKAVAADRGFLYLHPFAEPAAIAGHGSIGLEILEDIPDVDVVVVAVGGGGLIGGVAAAIKSRRPAVRIIGVEPTGADALTRSLEAGRPVQLPGISTRAVSLAPPMTEQINLDLAQRHVDAMVLVTDAEMERAAKWLWTNLSIPAELGGAASTAALLEGKVPLAAGRKVVSIVCGGGSVGIGKGPPGAADPACNSRAVSADLRVLTK